MLYTLRLGFRTEDDFMTKNKTIEVLESIKEQFVDCVRIANSPDAKDFQKESLSDNLDAVQALDIAINTINNVGLVYNRK